MVFEAKLAIMIVRHLTVINREQRTLSKKHDPTIHRVILKKSMHPIYAPMYALNVRVMISEAVDSKKRGSDNAWSGNTSRCRPCYRLPRRRQTRSCQLSSYRRRHRRPCQSPRRYLLRHTFAHILLYSSVCVAYLKAGKHTLDFRIVALGLSHKECSRFSIQWIGRVRIPEQLRDEDFEDVDHVIHG